MPLGTEVGLSPADFVLDGDPAPPQKGMEPPPQFSAHFYCGQTAECINMSLGMGVRLSPWDFVFDGDPVPHKGSGVSPLHNFRPMSIVTIRLDGSRWHLARMWASVQSTLC